MIPKIIHYCWFGPKAYSQTVRRCMATWRKHLQGYEFMLWNEESCAAYAAEHGLPNPMKHPFVVSAYKAKKYAFVADYVRFWALYYVGGIYLDTDMYVVRDFDTLLDNEFFCAWETAEDTVRHNAGGIVSCGALGACALGACALGACALGACARDILAKYDTLHFDETHLDKFIVPRIITPVILQHSEATIYPHDYFYPLPYQERFTLRKCKYNTSNTYAVHLWDISWGKWQAKWRDKVIYLIKHLI